MPTKNKKVGRRSSQDVEWQKLKELVFDRDKSCRFLRCLTVKEAYAFARSASKSEISILDPAHIFPVSTHLKLAYDPDNVVTLNRVAHKRLDDCEDPVTGEPITKDKRDEWWHRIAKSQYERLLIKKQEMNY